MLPDIAICIPVHNEAAELPGLFRALDELRRGPDTIVHVCILLDGCNDESAALVDVYRKTSGYRVSVGEVAVSAANAGEARRRAMLLGLSAVDDRDGILLTTDADSRPERDWLGHMWSALCHADIVVGRIVRSGDGGVSALQDRIEQYYDALIALRRRVDPVPWEADVTHHYTGGANMGFRPSAYRALGGFAPLASGEDAHLVDEAGRAGIRVRRDAACVVHTSDRRVGRAVGGLAHALRHCDHSDAAFTRVAHPQDAIWQYRLHAIARTTYRDSTWGMIADAIGISTDHVLGVARDSPNAEAFAMRIVPAPPNGMRSLSLPEAEAELAMLCRSRQAA